jgi:hypothetical protein
MNEPVMSPDDTSRSAKMSVILPTDTYETIRTVVQHLGRQTVRDQLEIVIVAPRAGSLGLVESELEGFAGVRIVPVESLRPLGAARAAGVRAARAQLVFIGETHSYAHPRCAEALIEAHVGPWAAVVPGFGNINPVGLLSWSLFLLDYGMYLHTFPARETVMAPIHNVAYKRAALLELGSELDRELAHGDQLLVTFHSRGFRTYFQPAARIDHLNVSRWAAWVSDRFQSGLLIGGRRAERWSAFRRLVYFVGAPLIPLVLMKRASKGARDARRQGAPFGTTPALILATIVSTVGEMIGYAGKTTLDADARLLEMELHRLPYVSPRSWANPDVLSHPLELSNP